MQGLKHMHSVDVYHRDLKPGNILINANCDCKVCDFGMARAKRPGQVEDDETVALWTDYVASRWYRAPELICCYLTPYTAAIDIWSVGCIACELLLRKAVFPGKNGEAQLELITDLLGAPSQEDMQSLRSARVHELLRTMRGKQPRELRTHFPPEADSLELEMIGSMLRFSAGARASAHECVESDYFTAIRDLPGAQIPYVGTPSLDPVSGTRHITLSIRSPCNTLIVHAVDDVGVWARLLTPLQEDFIYDDAKSLTKEKLRETLYAEVETYHPGVTSSGELWATSEGDR